MKINIYIAIILLTTVSSCDRRRELGSILKAECFWDILHVGVIHPINTCYKFDNYGVCNFFYYNFYNKKRTDSVYMSDDDDVVVPHRWSLDNDSIVIRANKYYIIRYNTDSIFLTATGSDTMILIKNCNSYSPRDQ